MTEERTANMTDIVLYENSEDNSTELVSRLRMLREVGTTRCFEEAEFSGEEGLDRLKYSIMRENL